MIIIKAHQSLTTTTLNAITIANTNTNTNTMYSILILLTLQTPSQVHPTVSANLQQNYIFNVVVNYTD